MSTSRDTLPATLTTARLRLRTPSRTDVPALVAQANNRRVHVMMAGLPFPFEESHALAFVDTIATSPQERPYAIELADGRFIGIVGLSLGDAATDFGYWLGEAFWGQGYASEAAAALVQAARAAGIGQLRARVRADNPASQRVLEKCGFAVVSHGVAETGNFAGEPVIFMQFEETP